MSRWMRCRNSWPSMNDKPSRAATTPRYSTKGDARNIWRNRCYKRGWVPRLRCIVCSSLHVCLCFSAAQHLFLLRKGLQSECHKTLSHDESTDKDLHPAVAPPRGRDHVRRTSRPATPPHLSTTKGSLVEKLLIWLQWQASWPQHGHHQKGGTKTSGWAAAFPAHSDACFEGRDRRTRSQRHRGAADNDAVLAVVLLRLKPLGRSNCLALQAGVGKNVCDNFATSVWHI